MATHVLTGEAARILGVSVNMVRYLERTGQLTAIRVGGMRIFEWAAVDALRIERYRRATGQPHWRG